MPNTTLPITGGCLCGAVRYEISEPSSTASICHCRDCQRSTGSAFAPVAEFPQASFRFIQGEPKRYKSRMVMEKYFCPHCGSQLTARYMVPVSIELQPHMVWVYIGTLDDPEIASIDDHYGVESQLSWVHFDDGLPRARCDEDSKLVAALAAAQANAE